MMHYKTTKVFYSLILAICFVPHMLSGKAERTKTITKNYPADTETIFQADHRYGPLHVIEYDGNEIQVELKIQISGNDESELEAALKEVQLREHSAGQRHEVETVMNIRTWNSNNRRTKITFRSGLTVNQVNDFFAAMTIKVPRINVIHLSNKYEDIHLSELNSNVVVELYSGELMGQDINGDLELSAKYSKLNTGNFQSGDLDIYDSKVDLGSCGDLDIESKYSEFEIENTGKLKINSYEDEFEIGVVNGDLDIVDKYSEFDITSCQDFSLDQYDGKIDIKTCNQVTGKLKYSDLIIGTAAEIELHSYDDHFTIGNLTSIKFWDGKYTEVNLGSLKESFSGELYDCDIRIDEIGPAFNSIKINSKYGKFSIPLSSNRAIDIDLESKYGKVFSNLEGEDELKYIEEDSRTYIFGKTGDDGILVKINAYDTSISLN